MKKRSVGGKKAKVGRCCAVPQPDTACKTGMCVNPDECAQMMKVLSDANRIKIVRALITGPSNVSSISERTGLSVHRISHHLGRMRLAKTVDSTRDGRNIVYRIADSVATPGGVDLGCACIIFRPLR
jgi:DNA-binding transcriptional ArsR family regulator